ncbi:enediyne biosynthesis protein [Amycolatopsis vancoresmycina]|uniref:enediyne biosynthesis protein n=1 Tax=Amycolatopsis vancoresmycina TaxID=208444 RepID=UPI00039EE4E6|nr:enediyne biosynthesis protein [Amycolatopsis vancoresmycina]
MATPITTKVDTAPPKRTNKVITALRRFAISITIFNILGYTVLGFEQPWLYPFIAVGTAYTTEILLEIINAKVTKREVRFRGNGFRGLVEFLYPAHISGLALNMLTYVNDHIWAMIFGVVVAVGAKWVLQAPVYGRLRHYMNPSNFGITIMLLVFPWVNMTPPYHFSEKVDTWVGWLIVAVILISGTVLNSLLTGRMWLIFGWLSFFVVQAFLRGALFGTAIPGALAMGTGIAFVLYTNYMVTDPGTSPSKPVSQFAFGAGIAMMYGFFTAAHIAYGLFFATASVCLIRGMYLWGLHFSNKARIKFEAEQAAQTAKLAAAPPAPAGEKPLAA